MNEAGGTFVGRKNGDPAPSVVLGGIGIQANHAVFEKTSKGYVLKPSSPGSLDQITVNGKKLTSAEGVLLKPNDRLIFGTSSVFLFKDPQSKDSPSHPDSQEEPVTWEQAQKEKSDIEDAATKRAQEEVAKRQEEEAKKRMEELEKEKERVRKEMEKEYAEKMKQAN
jgi:hypothetical protein